MDSPADPRFPALREAAWLLVATLVLTCLSWALRPDRLPPAADPTYYQLELAAPLVSPETALAHYASGSHLFVDTRPIAEGTAPTIPGAVPIRPETFDDDLLALFDFLFPEDPLILFGDGNLGGASNIAGRLLDRGYLDVLILEGGLGAWTREGGELSSPTEGGGS